MNIYVGNIASAATDEDLGAAFGAFGVVATAHIIVDQFSRMSRGFAFVEMPSETEARAAIVGLNGKELKGKTLTVNEARPRAERPRR